MRGQPGDYLSSVADPSGNHAKKNVSNSEGRHEGFAHPRACVSGRYGFVDGNPAVLAIRRTTVELHDRV
jgi:hypothetical protein